MNNNNLTLDEFKDKIETTTGFVGEIPLSELKKIADSEYQKMLDEKLDPFDATVLIHQYEAPGPFVYKKEA